MPGTDRHQRKPLNLRQRKNGQALPRDGARQANDRLERQLKFNAALLSAMPIPVFFTDRQGRYTGCNAAFTEQLGLSEDQIRGKTVRDLWPDEPSDLYLQRDLDLLRHPGHQAYEHHVIDRQGVKHDVIFAKDVYFDEHGQAAGLVCAYTDITERKKMEKVQAAVYRISEAAQTAGDLTDLYARIHAIIGELMPAENFYIALHDEASGLVSFPYNSDLVDGNEPPRPMRRGLTEYVIRTGQPLLATPEVFEALVAEGRVELVGAPSVDWLGAPLKTTRRTIGMMAMQSYTPLVRYTQADMDILTFVSAQVAMVIERKQAEEELRLSEERYRLVFQNAPVGLLLSSPEGEILDVNPATLRILGSPSPEATKAINLLTFPLLIKSGFSYELQYCLNTCQPRQGDMVYTSKWGKSVRLHFYLTPILDHAGQARRVQIILEDITEQVASDEKIRRLNRMLWVISQVNEALVYADQADDLMRRVCAILTTQGGYRLAWIGLAGPQTGQIRPVAQAGGEQGFLLDLQAIWGQAGAADDEPTQVALRSGEAVLASDLLLNFSQAPWRDAALARGFASSLALPLLENGQAYGVVHVYAGMPNAFDEEEIKLLTEMANDLSYGLTSLAARDERQRAELALRESEEKYRGVVERANDGITILQDHRVAYTNQRMAEMWGGTPDELVGQDITLFIEPQYLEDLVGRYQQRLSGEPVPSTYTTLLRRRDGSRMDAEINAGFLLYQGRPADLIIVRDITERKQTEQEIRRLNRDLERRAHQLSALNRAGQLLTSTLNPDLLLNLILNQAQNLMDVEAILVGLFDPYPENGSTNADLSPLVIKAAIGMEAEKMVGRKLSRMQTFAAQAVRENRTILALPAQTRPAHILELNQNLGQEIRDLIAVPLNSGGKCLGVAEVINKRNGVFDANDCEVLEALSSSAAIAIDNAYLMAASQRRARQLALLYEAGLSLNRTFNSRRQLEALCQMAMQALHADHSNYYHYDPARDEVIYQFGLGKAGDKEKLESLCARLGEPRGLIGLVAQQRTGLYLPDVTQDERWVVTDPEIRSGMWAPVLYEDRLLGLLFMGSTVVDAFSLEDQQLLAALANQLGVSLENANLYGEALDYNQRSTTMHWLSQEIIGASHAPEDIYATIHQAVSKLIQGEVFVITMLEESSDELLAAYSYDSGQRYPVEKLRCDEGLSGYVLATGESLLVQDLENTELPFTWRRFGSPRRARSVVATPMHIGARVLGVMSVQSYQPNTYSAEDARLLETLATYAALALENAKLFAQMQASNVQLGEAYEAIVESWSRALEMRDKETKGHSERVTRLSLRLAQMMGMPENQIANFRRGVRLHDIGKMAIPDAILFKPGPLTADEWMVMRNHPLHAYQMLAGIPFISQSIDIPYCHHERWDGSGYPRKLQGEQIPLGARIFAVVDVWDALTSDRPYRMAWEPAQVASYIEAQAGIQFDPQVVAAFLQLWEAGEI